MDCTMSEVIYAETSRDALVNAPWKLGDKNGDYEVVGIHARLLSPGVYKVYPELRNMTLAAIDFATQPQYVGNW